MDSGFAGQPATVWLIDKQERCMQLTSDFCYVDRDGKKWPAPKCMSTDGASIPRALWSVVGSPFTGHYRRAALVHDYACVQADGDQAKRREADRMFYLACRDGGCSPREATILYIGVRIGAVFGSVAAWGLVEDEPHPRLALSLGEQRLLKDFQQIAANVLSSSDAVADDDIATIERQTDAAMTSVLGAGLVVPPGSADSGHSDTLVPGSLAEHQKRLMSVLSPAHIEYEIDGHLCTTFIVAMSAGLPKARALELAWGSQMPDANGRFTATSAAWTVLWSKHSERIMQTLHSLHGGGPAEVLKRRDDLCGLIGDALRQGEPDWKVGLMIHAFGDSYAHTYAGDGGEHAYGLPLGHAIDLGAPDEIARSGQKYLTYVTRLFGVLGGRGDAHLGLAQLFQIVERGSGDVSGVSRQLKDYANELGLGGQDGLAMKERLKASISMRDVDETMSFMEARFVRAI